MTRAYVCMKISEYPPPLPPPPPPPDAQLTSTTLLVNLFIYFIYLYCVVTDARCNRSTYQDYIMGAGQRTRFPHISDCITVHNHIGLYLHIPDSIYAAQTLSVLVSDSFCETLCKQYTQERKKMGKARKWKVGRTILNKSWTFRWHLLSVKFSACHDCPQLPCCWPEKIASSRKTKKWSTWAFVYCDFFFVASRKIYPSIVTFKIRRREEFLQKYQHAKNATLIFRCHRLIFVCLFDLILYVKLTIFQFSWVEPVLTVLS